MQGLPLFWPFPVRVTRVMFMACVGVFIAFLSTACKKEVVQTGAPPTEVRMGYFANLTHAQAVLGVSTGDFEKAVAPSKFSTKVFNAGPSLIEALFAGEIDIGYVGPGPALTAFDKSKGQGVRVIAGAAANGVLIVARKDAGINSLADLAGKKVATPQLGNTQDIAARHYLSADLKQPDLSNVLPIANAEQAAMMSRGQVDAAWAPEPWASLLVAQSGAKVISAERDLWPERTFAITLVITTPEFLKTHADAVEKVLRVHETWTDRLRDQPDAYAPQLDEALFKLTTKRLPPGVGRAALANVVFTDDPLDHTCKKFAQWSYDLRFSKQLVDTAGLVDTTLLRQVRGPGAGPQSMPTTVKN